MIEEVKSSALRFGRPLLEKREKGRTRPLHVTQFRVWMAPLADQE
jgi:hypothetical protein